jgi:capsular polysaccharide biosynthesis protein
VPSSVVLLTLRRFWWAVVVVALVTGYLASVAVGSMNATYESQARLLVGQLQGSTDSLRASAALGATYADALSSETLLERVATKAGLRATSAEQLVTAADVAFNDKSRILTIGMTWSNAATAHRLTSLMVAETTKLKDQGPPAAAVPKPTPDVLAQEVLRQASGAVTVIQPATVPKQPTDTNSTTIAILAAVAGAVLAFTILCFWISRRHRARLRVRQSFAAADYLGSAMSAGRSSRARRSGDAVLLKGRGAADYVRLAGRLEVRATVAPLRSLCVVGAGGAHIAAEVALNLAAAFAAAGRQVTLVDPTGRIRSVRQTAPQLTVVQVGRPQDETEIARRLMPSKEAPADELLVLVLPSLIFPTAGSWWLSSADAVLLAGTDHDPAMCTDIVDCMDEVVRRGGALLGVMLLRDGSPLARLTTPPESPAGA